MNQDVYEMKLHDEIEIWSGAFAIRVPGGWLYRFDQEAEGGLWRQSCAFVPYSDEFSDDGKQPDPTE